MTTAAQAQNVAGSAIASDLSQEPISVYISRVFRAPRERVFNAWTKPEQMLRWRAPGGWEVIEVHSDPRPGGEHRVVIRGTPQPKSPGDTPVEVAAASWGVYLDVEPYVLLRFTWWADWAPGEESVVTVRLSDAEDGGTLMDFTHDKFLTPESASAHNLGWDSAFNRLATLAEG
jgi:uncharacterized protein YndB with AHSA1/START domain